MALRTDAWSRLLLVVSYLAAAVVFSGLLGPYLTWRDEPMSAQVMTLFLLPTTATVIYSVVRRLRGPGGARPDDGHGHAASDEALDGIVLCVIAFLAGMHAVVLGVLLNVDVVQPWASRTVVVLLGLATIGVGNLLPRTRPNVALGIRTSRTLGDRHLWMLTHRVTGYVVCGVGLLTVAAGLFLSGTHVAALPSMAALAGGVVIASYYRQVVRRPLRSRPS